ncbi:hypothetical protein BO82DRAFT_64883 [Aspergillus uvarum CBS 121591]|uniref:Uncharacterized protein n=1 Tax=Aspergillus uvarum CBS 121591 TaxID=1448315 RepID=A0A319CD89_9EURO|nr:hypothetical protein BO82DRAFT_64883 [Aspergillus uvarum CBS 121591]PYH82269.1 hypothetical protein BO82DRAFT_64883 [Aspergillus uvarum CBS 121591]
MRAHPPRETVPRPSPPASAVSGPARRAAADPRNLRVHPAVPECLRSRSDHAVPDPERQCRPATARASAPNPLRAGFPRSVARLPRQSPERSDESIFFCGAPRQVLRSLGPPHAADHLHAWRGGRRGDAE